VLELQHHDGEPGIGHAWPAAVRKPPFTYLLGLDARRWLAFERSYGQVTDVDVQLFRGTTTVRFASPVGFRAGWTALVSRPGIASGVRALSWPGGRLGDDLAPGA
jgi:hypothetical protein